MDSTIKSNIAQIIKNIRERAAASGRDANLIKLMAATKTVDEDRIREAIAGGITIIGENYVQDAAQKKSRLERAGPIEWHMIGRLQTNKAKYAVRLFDMIHSLDRMELAMELDKRSRAIGRVAKVLIEVNTGVEATKSGVLVKEAIDLVRAAATLENISIEGLMTIPPWGENPETSRPYFVTLRKLKEEIEAANIPRVQMGELSMGMTEDYLIAIEEGATIVRIGRGIFGERQKTAQSTI